MMLATSLFAGRSLTRSVFLPCSSFHSALKKQLKAEMKAKDKEAKPPIPSSAVRQSQWACMGLGAHGAWPVVRE